MTDGLKFAAVGIICAAVTLLVKEFRPELAPFMQAGGIIVFAALLLEYLKKLLESATELFAEFDVLNMEYLSLLIKILGIAAVTEIGSDICEDSGNSALAENVGLAGRILILFMSFPLIKTVAQLAGGLIG